MRLLLDTDALLWWARSDERLGERAWTEMHSRENAVWVSTASVWETAIKFASGKLQLAAPPAALLSDDVLAGAGFQPLTIANVHALKAGALPRHHGDPFDRMLIAQAQTEDLTIVTSDPAFDDYDVRILDARR